MSDLDRHNERPELFTVVGIEIPPYGVTEQVLPRLEHYGPVVSYLSERVMAGESPSDAYLDIIDGEEVTRRDCVKNMLGLELLAREVRSVDQAPESLPKRIYTGDRNFGQLLDPVTGAIAPRKFSIYDGVLGDVREVQLLDFPAGGTDEEAYEATDLELARGNTGDNSLIARHGVYIYLAFMADMPPPPVGKVRR